MMDNQPRSSNMIGQHIRADNSGSFAGAVVKGMTFPAILCGVIFICSVVGSPSHSIVFALKFSAGLLALLAVPVIAFTFLRWQSSSSRSSLAAFQGRVRQRITSAYDDKGS
jgi:hypothetical protein